MRNAITGDSLSARRIADGWRFTLRMREDVTSSRALLVRVDLRAAWPPLRVLAIVLDPVAAAAHTRTVFRSLGSAVRFATASFVGFGISMRAVREAAAHAAQEEASGR